MLKSSWFLSANEYNLKIGNQSPLQWISTCTICLHCPSSQGLGERKIFAIEHLGDAGVTTMVTAGKELIIEDWLLFSVPPNAIGNIWALLFAPDGSFEPLRALLIWLLPPSLRGSSDSGLKWKSKLLEENGLVLKQFAECIQCYVQTSTFFWGYHSKLRRALKMTFHSFPKGGFFSFLHPYFDYPT